MATLTVWRLSARRRARDLDGAGNRARGARWNSAAAEAWFTPA